MWTYINLPTLCLTSEKDFSGKRNGIAAHLVFCTWSTASWVCVRAYVCVYVYVWMCVCFPSKLVVKKEGLQSYWCHDAKICRWGIQSMVQMFQIYNAKHPHLWTHTVVIFFTLLLISWQGSLAAWFAELKSQKSHFSIQSYQVDILERVFCVLKIRIFFFRVLFKQELYFWLLLLI